MAYGAETWTLTREEDAVFKLRVLIYRDSNAWDGYDVCEEILS